MRRKDKEINAVSGIESIIADSAVCRLAMINGDQPYMVPLSFGYRDQTLYFHGALKGQKIDVLRANPKVCFEFDLVAEAIRGDEACDWSMKYKSVIGFGTATFIEGLEEKRQALDIIMAHYSDKQFQFTEEKVKVTAVFKVEIERMTAKQSGF